MEKVLMTHCLLILLHELWSSCIIWSTVKRWISIFRGREMYGHPKLVTFPQGQKFHAGTNVKLWDLFLIGNDRKFFFYPRRKGGWKIATLLLKCYGCGFMLMCVCISSISNVTHMAEFRRQTLDLQCVCLWSRPTCNKRQMHFARNWHKYFLQAFRSRYKIFFLIWKIILGEREFNVCPLLELDWC